MRRLYHVSCVTTYTGSVLYIYTCHRLRENSDTMTQIVRSYFLCRLIWLETLVRRKHETYKRTIYDKVPPPPSRGLTHKGFPTKKILILHFFTRKNLEHILGRDTLILLPRLSLSLISEMESIWDDNAIIPGDWQCTKTYSASNISTTLFICLERSEATFVKEDFVVSREGPLARKGLHGCTVRPVAATDYDSPPVP